MDCTCFVLAAKFLFLFQAGHSDNWLIGHFDHNSSCATLTPSILGPPANYYVSSEPILSELAGFPGLTFNTIWAETVSRVISVAAVRKFLRRPFGFSQAFQSKVSETNGLDVVLPRDIGAEVAKLCSGQADRARRQVEQEGKARRFERTGGRFRQV
jgi:hypothetical protein